MDRDQQMKKPRPPAPPMVFKKHAPKPHPTMALRRQKRTLENRGMPGTMPMRKNIVRERGGL